MILRPGGDRLALVASLLMVAAGAQLLATGVFSGAKAPGLLLEQQDLSGRVLFSGLAVPGVTVSAIRAADSAQRKPELQVSTLSDDQGVFRLANLDAGPWVIRVEMRGFASLSRDVTIPFNEESLSFTLTMRAFDEIASSPAPASSPALPEGPSTLIAASESTAKAADTVDIINGSSINGAASVFAQPRAFGNNRPRQVALYTGGITAVLGNSAWNARPYSFAGSTAVEPSYSDAQLAFTLGGPLKVPWLVKYGPQTLVSYQHGVSHNATTQSALMPTADQRRGDFSQSPIAIRDPRTGLPFAGNLIPPDRIGSQARALLALYPLPNGDLVRGANFQVPIIGKTTSDSFQITMSKNLTFRTSLGGVIGYTRSVTDSRNVFDFADTNRQSTLNATVSLTRRVSTRLQLSARYQLTRSASRVTPFFANRTNVSADAGIAGNSQDPSNWGPPTLSFPDIADLRDGDYQRTLKTTHVGSAEALLRRGRHNLKLGGDVRWNLVDVQSQPDPRGTLAFTGAASGNAFADFLLGIPTTSSIAFGETGASLREAAFDAYVDDDFRVGAGLTLNVGVRWEYEAPYSEKAGRLANLNVAPGFTATSLALGSSLHPDRLGIEPRLAVSWRPVLGSSLVLRGSYGLYRNLGVYQPLGIILAQQPPFSRTVEAQNTPLTPLTLASPFPASLANTITNTFAVDPNFRAGYAHNWQASAQRDLPASLTVIAAYFGEKGTHLMQAFRPNTYPAGAVNPCATCPSGFVYVTSNGTSLRHAGQFTIRRRLHAGFTATAQYTLAKATDDAATFSNTSVRPSSLAIAQDWLDLGAERGPSSFDQRHLLSLQAQYTTGVGVTGGTLVDGVWGSIYKDWTITSQLTAGSGLPLTPIAFAAVPGSGTVGVRPSLTGIPAAATVAGSYANAAAFTAPLSGTWGNAGRNSIRGPSQFALDASIARVFRLRGRVNLEWRIAATNVLNRVTFATINTVITSPQFGLPTAANAMRRIQTTFRLRF